MYYNNFIYFCYYFRAVIHECFKKIVAHSHIVIKCYYFDPFQTHLFYSYFDKIRSLWYHEYHNYREVNYIFTSKIRPSAQFFLSIVELNISLSFDSMKCFTYAIFSRSNDKLNIYLSIYINKNDLQIV